MINPPKILITTAIEESWSMDLPVLCLGAWCCSYDRREEWGRLQAETVPYHWDDRNKMYSDYLYLRDLHEVLLTEISEKLNALHGRNHSRRYWRILVGPWLLYFTQMLFDRWETVKYALEEYNIYKTLIINYPQQRVIPKNMDDFRNMYVADEWNHFIYGRILSGWTSIKCELILSKSRKENSNVEFSSPRKRKRSFKRLIYNKIIALSQLFSGSRSAFFIHTSLPLKHEILLQLALWQFPSIYQQKSTVNIEANLDLRRDFKLNAEIYKDFENCIRVLIVEQMPTIYLEGYKNLEGVVSSLPWPESPKVIFTSASYNADDIFKEWAGRMVDKGTPLVIGQHGGNLGSALWSSSEDHENSIADLYLTWGWVDEKHKQYPIGNLKKLERTNGSWNPKGDLLLITSVMPKFSYVMGSYTVSAGQIESSIEDQYKFVNCLRIDIRNNVVLRLFKPDWGWSQEKRWRDRFPDISIDLGDNSIHHLFKTSRLCVVTYNATTILEVLSQNIPTIIFWNSSHWEIRPSAEPFFNRLREVGILFDRPERAAEKVEQIWSNVEVWWSSLEIQDARREFCEQYARTCEKPIRMMRNAFNTIIQ